MVWTLVVAAPARGCVGRPANLNFPAEFGHDYILIPSKGLIQQRPTQKGVQLPVVCQSFVTVSDVWSWEVWVEHS